MTFANLSFPSEVNLSSVLTASVKTEYKCTDVPCKNSQALDHPQNRLRMLTTRQVQWNVAREIGCEANYISSLHQEM